MIQERISGWRILFYLSLLVVTVWLILKLAGVIQSPVWLEYGVPFAGLLIGFLALFQELLKNIHAIALDVNTLKLKVDHHDQEINFLKQELNFLKQELINIRDLIKKKIH